MMRDPRPNEIVFPALWFNGFHPDIVDAVGPQGPLASPLGYLHSSLALYGWKRGLSVRETAQLFSDPVFEAVKFYDYMSAAQGVLIEEAQAAALPLDGLFAQWDGRCFMHTPNHAKLGVTAEIARAITRKAGLRAELERPEDYLADAFLNGPIWPVYPEIAERLRVPGSFVYRAQAASAGAAGARLLNLDEFITRSFAIYAEHRPDTIRCDRLESPLYRDLEGLRPARHLSEPASVYANLPARQFWRSAIASVPPSDVDPVNDSPFPIVAETRIATAGSCFAQHVSRALDRSGYTFYVAEAERRDGGSRDTAAFSARYGNVYTARQLLQLFQRAYGTFVPHDTAWLRPDGRYVDPFRPRIEADGFASASEVADARTTHLAAVRTMFETLDVLVFTLGMTEAWRAKGDGAVFPLAPGVSAGRMDFARYEFCNFTVADVLADMRTFLAGLKRVNPRARLVLTVSPVPLAATYESRHVLVSTTSSKSALRTAAEEIARSRNDVWYFPAYEIVTGSFNRGSYFESDLRSVTVEGVDHVMRLFVSHCASGGAEGALFDASLIAESRAQLEVTCDEDAIAPVARPAPRPLQIPGEAHHRT
ncbi:MAG: hypothetical protein NVSMB64_05640 [Candidatus Velthaea sp.]